MESPQRTRFTRLDVLICALLLLATAAVYGQVHSFDFVNYDDPDYVTENVHTRSGLSAQNVEWAFTSSYAANWIPLTWISHMLDCQLFGLDSGRHHISNVLLHLLSVLLLYAALRKATGSHWRSAFVAFLFALHPLHVESVAWIAERKDVLSGFFWFLTLLLYVLYVERRSTGRYVLVLAAFSFGLMAKAMLVTLPVVLLLFDLWPLGRKWSKQLAVEKLPLLAVAATVSGVTYFVQQRGGAVLSLAAIPLMDRIQNALVSYVLYLGQTLWPARLAAFYPYPTASLALEAMATLLAILGVSLFCVRKYAAAPFLAVGWFWYLVTLTPVIGLVQIGEQAHADRYTYIPLVGIFLVAAWGGTAFLDHWPKVRVSLASAACLACMVLTWNQIGVWRNSATLFQHAAEVTAGNYVAYTNLGLQARAAGQTEEAVRYYDTALQARPHFVDAENDLAEARIAQGRPADALPYLADALRAKPDFVEARINLGSALEKLGQSARAAEEYREALKLQPDNAVAHAGLGACLADQGQKEEGIRELQRAIAIDPTDADAHSSLGLILANSGRVNEAIGQFADAVRLRSNDADAHYNLATALGSADRLDEAIEHFTIAIRLRPRDVNFHVNLGKAFANNGRLDDAAKQFEEALTIDPNSNEAKQSLAAVRSAADRGGR